MNADGVERNQEATLFVGELDAQVTESLLWELFLQAGPVVNVHIPRDKVSNDHQSFGFVEFHSVLDAESNRDTRSADLGANLFIGNLDHDADEALLQTTFAVFGPLLGPPKIMREPDTGRSRGFGFISYDSFEAADTAIANMNGQYICNRPITVSFALKKDGKGERHGTETERMLAAQSRNNRTGGVASASGSIVPQPVLMPKIANPAFAALQMPTMMAPAGLAGPFVMPGAGVVPMPQFHPQ